MTLKNYLSVMFMMSVVCWSAFAYIVVTINPDTTNTLGYVLFYSSLFLSLAGTSSIIGFLIRFSLMKQKLVFRLVNEAFRQSFLFSFLMVAYLFLLDNHLLTWTNLLFLVLGLTFFEFFLVYQNRAKVLKRK